MESNNTIQTNPLNYTYINMEDVPDSAWGNDNDNYFDNFINEEIDMFDETESINDDLNYANSIYDNFGDFEIDLLTKNLNAISKSLESYNDNPTIEIKSIKEQYESLCKDGQKFIESSFLLKTLSSTLNNKIMQCEQLYDDIEYVKSLEQLEKEEKEINKRSIKIETNQPYKKNKRSTKIETDQLYKRNKYINVNDNNAEVIQRFLNRKKNAEQNNQILNNTQEIKTNNELLSNEQKRTDKQIDEYMKWLKKM